jgi:hypothetical protein
MSLYDKITHAKDALEFGQQLANAATWKQRQSRLNALAGFVASALYFVPEFRHIDSQIITDFAGGIGAVYALVNWYFTNATSKKVGV